MTKFSGIWRTDREQFSDELEKRVFGVGSLDTRFGDSELACAFLDQHTVIFGGTDFVFCEIGADDDPEDFFPEDLADGFRIETIHVVRHFEYRISSGELLLKSVDFPETGWQLMPFRHETDRTFLIKPLGYFQRMLPTTLDDMEAEPGQFGFLARGWIKDAARQGLRFNPTHGIAEGLIDSPDDAIGFDPMTNPRGFKRD